MKLKKCTYFLLTFVLILSFGIIQKKEVLKAEESGVSSGHIYKVSPTGYVCGTTPPSANILEAQFVPDDANHNIEVRVRKCAGGNLISDGNAYVRVDNFKDYTYEVSTTDYICGTTPPTQGIVALRLTPDDTNHDLYVRVRKCDSGDFSKDGKVYITVDGQQKWGPYDYNAGDSSIRFDINPVGHSEGIVGKHTYQAEVYPTGQAEPILSGEIDVWETYASYTWGPFFRNAGVSEFTFDIDPVDDKSIVGTHTYQVHWYPNGQDNPIRTGNIEAWDEAVTSVDLRPINESIETLAPFFAGSTVGLQASVKNEGSASAGQSVLGYYISDSSSGSALEPGTIRTNTVPALSAGGSSALLYEDLYIPINAQVGTTYYAVFEADIDTDVAESDESNNKASKTLTVQACDTSAMYCDVPPGHTFQAEVEALRDHISNGCNSRANVPYRNAVFCPEMLLDRASMAVFAVRRRLGYNATLGTYQGYFTDVSEDTPFALWIEKAYELDIVGGCEGSTPGVDLKYCPNYDTSGWAGIVTRAQVAIFLARTEGWDLSDPTTGVFDDVTGDNEWERAVEYMWWQGYIHGVPLEIGCQNSTPSGDLIYCGSDYVNRGTAAGFMSRVFGYVTTIRGYVRDSNNNGIDGVTINFSGGYGSVETSHGGFYHHTGFPDGTYTLTPSKSGYSFTPSSATVSATGGNVTQDFVVTDAASPALTRSRLYVDERNYLVLEFCGTNIHQDVYIGSKRAGRDFGVHTMRVDFGATETCATDNNLADGSVLPSTTYQSGVALASQDVYVVCGSASGLCDSVLTSPATPVDPPVIPPGGSCPVPFFWQCDPSWKAHPLRTGSKYGTCSSGCGTICNCGCTLTSSTMLFKHYGAHTTSSGQTMNPANLSDCMGNHACPFVWGTGNQCTSGKAPSSQVLFSWTRLEQELAQGQPVMLTLDRDCQRRDGTWTICHHWIVAVSGSGNNAQNYLVNDPALKQGARMTLGASLVRNNYNYRINQYMRVYSGKPICQNSNSKSIETSNTRPFVLSTSDPITGAIIQYRNTESTMTLEISAQSINGTVNEMLIWTSSISNTTWQPFAEYVALPLSEQYFARFRDETGVTSEIVATSVEGSPLQVHIVFLPVILRQE